MKPYPNHKSITFDKEAQDNLPQHIKDKMKANMDKARKEQKIKACDYCNGSGWDSYPNHSTTMPPCPKCQP